MTVQEAIGYLRMATDEAEGYCDEYIEMCEMSIKALEEVEQYRALGTVEELKEARGKQIPKKPKYKIKRPNSLYGVCSVCDRQLVTDKYCPRCGQAIDWEEGGTSD